MTKQAPAQAITVPVFSAVNNGDSASKTHMFHPAQSTAMDELSDKNCASHSAVLINDHNSAGCSGVSQQVFPDQTLHNNTPKQSNFFADFSAESDFSESVSNEHVSAAPVLFEPVSPESVSMESVSAEQVSTKPVSAELTATDQALAVCDYVGKKQNLSQGTASVQNQTINYIVNNVYHQSAPLNLGSGHEWKVPYEKCHIIAQHLDLRSIPENWKMLASKLKLDRVIEGVERTASNQGESPTVILLREWMKNQIKDDRETCYQGLIKALEDMGRADIIDALEDADH